MVSTESEFRAAWTCDELPAIVQLMPNIMLEKM
jgi:hypothetical protein